jgi:hypothetical protein
MNHNGGEAAGWIIDVNQAPGRNVIEFTPRWNMNGAAAIGSDTMRYFSPTIDIEHKTIIGGSLTNWPATRTPEHQILLRPVELSSQMQTYAEPPWYEKLMAAIQSLIKPADVQAKENNIVNEEIETTPIVEAVETVSMPPVELAAPVVTTTLDLSSPDIQQLITQQAETRVTALMAEREHAASVVQLATRLTGGTPEKPTGLPVGYDRLAAFLEKIPAELYPEAEAILTAAAERAPIEFSEAGHSRVVQGTKPLPDAIKPVLESWLSKKLSLADFFEANSDQLGAMSDYNLTEFIKE